MAAGLISFTYQKEDRNSRWQEQKIWYLVNVKTRNANSLYKIITVFLYLNHDASSKNSKIKGIFVSCLVF